MPPIGFELDIVQEIADQFERLGRTLRTYPLGDGQPRTARSAAPSKAILSSLRKINATLSEGARRESLSSAAFTTLGHEFDKIGATLSAVAGAAKTTAKTTTRTTRKTTRR